MEILQWMYLCDSKQISQKYIKYTWISRIMQSLYEKSEHKT